MYTNAQYQARDDRPVEDHIVNLHHVSWEDYESLLTMRGERYVPVKASEVLPGLDLDLLSSFLDRPTTSEAIRGYRQALQMHGEAV